MARIVRGNGTKNRTVIGKAISGKSRARKQAKKATYAPGTRLRKR